MNEQHQAWRGSRLVRLTLPAGLVAGLLIALCVGYVQDRAGAYARAAMTAERMRSVAEGLDDRDLWAPERLAAGEREDVRRDSRRLRELLRSIRASGAESDELPRLQALVDEYLALVEEALETDPARSTASEREESYEETVDPVFESVLVQIESAFRDLSRRSREADDGADLFVFIFIPVATLLVALGFARSEAHRRRLAVGELERRHNARFRSLVRNSTDFICVTDGAGRCTFVTQPAARLLDAELEDVVGRELSELVTNPATVSEALVSAAASSSPAEVTLCTHPGPRHLAGTCLDLSADPYVDGFVWNLRDVTAEEELKARLLHQSSHDALTGLGNRRLFEERAGAALAASRRSGRPVALLLLDCDGFKAINDELGHWAGDEVLVAVAERCLSAVRPVDTVARLGGDEFAVLLDGSDASAAALVAQRISESLQAPLTIDAHTVVPSASIGLHVGGPHTRDIAELQHEADAAMYAAKAARSGSPRSPGSGHAIGSHRAARRQPRAPSAAGG